MASNQNSRKILKGKLRCGSQHHVGNRMRPVIDFCKAKTPDGLTYSCKHCRTKENKLLGHASYMRWKKRDPIRAMLQGAKGSAIKKNISFTLAKDDILIPAKCPILNIPLFFSEKRTDNTPSIDRIDNSKGYTPKNIIVCSWRANILKKDATINELTLMANFYKRISK